MKKYNFFIGEMDSIVKGLEPLIKQTQFKY